MITINKNTLKIIIYYLLFRNLLSDELGLVANFF